MGQKNTTIASMRPRDWIHVFLYPKKEKECMLRIFYEEQQVANNVMA